jgi:DeoR/GlpR family transcriptional regulator of sugar metabolism
VPGVQVDDGPGPGLAPVEGEVQRELPGRPGSFQEAAVEVEQAAMACAAHSVLVAGSSQYGTFGRYRVAPLTAFDTVVTDAELTDATAEGIRDGGSSLVLAQS